MPIVKYATAPGAREGIFQAISAFKDIAIVDISTKGHNVLNNGHLSNYLLNKESVYLYSSKISDIDIALSDFSETEILISNLIETRRFKAIFLLPTAISQVTGQDLAWMAKYWSDKFSFDIFTCSVRFEDDFLLGMQNIYLQLTEKYISDKHSESNKIQINILTDTRFDKAGRVNNEYLKSLLSNYFDVDICFSFGEYQNTDALLEMANAKLNLILSPIFKKSAEFMEYRYGIKYLSVNYLSDNGEKELIENIEKYLNIKAKHEYIKSSVNENIRQIVKNVFDVNSNIKIRCCLREDRLNILKEYFASVDISDRVEFYSYTKNTEYEYMSIDEFIDKYKNDKDVILISLPRLNYYTKRNIIFDDLGLDYILPIEYENESIGIKTYQKLSQELLYMTMYEL